MSRLRANDMNYPLQNLGFVCIPIYSSSCCARIIFFYIFFDEYINEELNCDLLSVFVNEFNDEGYLSIQVLGATLRVAHLLLWL